MTPSPPHPPRSSRTNADTIWDQAPGVVEQLELAASAGGEKGSVSSLSQNALKPAISLCGAVAGRVTKRTSEPAMVQVLAVDDPGARFERSSASDWIAAERFIADNQAVEMQLILSVSPNPETRVAAQQLCEAICGVIAGVAMREQVDAYRFIATEHASTTNLIKQLSGQSDAIIRLSMIAQWVQNQTAADRVCLLHRVGSTCQLLASSVQPNPDRRARVVEAIESLGTAWLSGDQSVTQLSPETSVGDVEDLYFTTTGSIRTVIHPVQGQPDDGEVVGLIVQEWFEEELDSVPQTVGDSFWPTAQSLVRDSLALHSRGWTARVWGHLSRSRGWVGAIIFCGIVLFLIWPVTLTIEAEGRLAAVSRRTIYSPANATISSVLVDDGQRVVVDQTLLTLRSDELQELESRLQGELSTVTAKLQVASSRRLDSGDAGRRGVESAASDEKVLLVEKEALTKRLALAKKRIESLNVRSPIDGIVQHWQLEQSLELRPVNHGQPLFTVADPESGWTVQIDIPESESGYVRAAGAESRHCVFRVRAHPDRSFTGKLDQLATVTQPDLSGRSILRAESRVGMVPETLSEVNLSSGTTVVASIQCDRYSRGFVLFRDLISWGRLHGWW